MIHIETYYLIDYENVHGEGLEGCQDLGKTDHIVIFFTQFAKNIDMSDISNHGEAQLDMIEVPTGKQSADMHIVSYLGYLAGTGGKDCGVVIVSKDTDFDNVIKFWNQKTKVKASRTEQIKKKPVSKQSRSTKKSSTSKDESTKKTSTSKDGGTKKMSTSKDESTKKTSTSKDGGTKKASTSKDESTKKTTTSKDGGTKKTGTSKDEGAKKTGMNREVMQAVRKAGFETSVANTVAQIAAGSYGSEHILAEVHNELQDRYSNYLEVYEAVKPVLTKYAQK